MSKTETSIRKHLESGKSLTTLQSLDKFKTYRTSEYIRRLRVSGMKIETVRMTTKEGKVYAKYILQDN